MAQVWEPPAVTARNRSDGGAASPKSLRPRHCRRPLVWRMQVWYIPTATATEAWRRGGGGSEFDVVGWLLVPVRRAAATAAAAITIAEAWRCCGGSVSDASGGLLLDAGDAVGQ